MRSEVDTLDLVERDLLAQTIVELGGAGGLVPGDPGCDLEVTAVPKVFGDPGPAEAVCTDLGGYPRFAGAALDHLEGAQARQRPVRGRIAAPRLAAPEEGPASVLADPGGLEAGVDAFLGGVVGRDRVVSSPLLVGCGRTRRGPLTG